MIAFSKLGVLDVQCAKVEFAGETFEIYPFTAGDLPKLSAHAQPIIDALSSHDSSENPIADALNLIALNGDAVIDMIALATRTPADEVRKAYPHQLVPFVEAIITVNAEYFRARLLPAVQALIARVNKEATGGPTPSNA